MDSLLLSRREHINRENKGLKDALAKREERKRKALFIYKTK